MNFSADARASMRMRMPSSEQIRNLIAAHAAEASGQDPAFFLAKLGAIQPVQPAHEDYGTAWRLSSYHGTAADGDVIEHAIAQVHRTFPFMEAG